MKRSFAILMSAILVMLTTVACADPARFLNSDKNADYHWRHLQQHIGSQNCMVSGNYIKIRPEAGSKKVIGHLEKADAFTLDDVQDGWAKITVVFHAKTSPDSRVGLSGWINADYVECQCSSDEYYGGTARTTYSLATVTAKTGNLREEPSKSSPNHAKIKQGEQIEVLGEYTGKDNNTWYRVRYGDKVGFLRADMVEITQNGIPEAFIGQPVPNTSAANTSDIAESTEVSASPASGPDEDANGVMPDNSSGVDVNGAWQNAYRQFITSGQYKSMIASKILETISNWEATVDEIQFVFALYDIDQDGIPELIVKSICGPEQLDIYTFNGETVVHLGAMGGDNFFQWIFYYPDSGNYELFVAQGGPMMIIERCTYVGGIFQDQTIGNTLISSDGEVTIGLELSISDDALYDRLYQSLVNAREDFVTVEFSQEAEFLAALQSTSLQNGGQNNAGGANTSNDADTASGESDASTGNGEQSSSDPLDGYYEYDDSYQFGEPIGKYIPVKLSVDTEVYYAGVPITFSADILGGVPPFSVSWMVEESQVVEGPTALYHYAETHSDYSNRTAYVTNDRHVEFVYIPPVDSTTLFGKFGVTDVNGISSLSMEEVCISVESASETNQREEDTYVDNPSTSGGQEGTETTDDRQTQFLMQTYASWSDAYYHFVVDKIYEQIGYPDYYFDNYEYIWMLDGNYKLEYRGDDSDPIHFTLFDLDDDGIPELFVYNGEGSMAGNMYHVYTFRDGKIKYAGSLGERELMLSYDPERRYPGLVQSDGHAGEYYTEYWYMENDKIECELIESETFYSNPDADFPDSDSDPIVTRETDNADLYEWAKHSVSTGMNTYTYDDVMRMGWGQFVASFL